MCKNPSINITKPKIARNLKLWKVAMLLWVYFFVYFYSAPHPNRPTRMKLLTISSYTMTVLLYTLFDENASVTSADILSLALHSESDYVLPENQPKQICDTVTSPAVGYKSSNLQTGAAVRHCSVIYTVCGVLWWCEKGLKGWAVISCLLFIFS